MFLDLVSRIQSGCVEAEAELYSLIADHVRSVLYKNRAQIDSFEDALHDVYIVLLKRIRANRLPAPEALLATAQKIAKFWAFSEHRAHRNSKTVSINEGLRETRNKKPLSIADAIPCRKSDPARVIEIQHRKEIARNALDTLRPQDREILERFYLDGQSAEDIERDMRLTHTQFRLLKNRAKTKFAAAGKEIALAA